MILRNAKWYFKGKILKQEGWVQQWYCKTNRWVFCYTYVRALDSGPLVIKSCMYTVSVNSVLNLMVLVGTVRDFLLSLKDFLFLLQSTALPREISQNIQVPLKAFHLIWKESKIKTNFHMYTDHPTHGLGHASHTQHLIGLLSCSSDHFERIKQPANRFLFTMKWKNGRGRVLQCFLNFSPASAKWIQNYTLRWVFTLHSHLFTPSGPEV